MRRTPKKCVFTQLVGELGFYPPATPHALAAGRFFAEADEDADTAEADPARRQLMERLYMARRHVAQGEQLIASQQALIGRLDRGGHNTAQASLLLSNLLDAQALHQNHLRQLEETAAFLPAPVSYIPNR